MKNKFYIITGIALVLIIFVGVMYLIDMKKVNNNGGTQISIENNNNTHTFIGTVLEETTTYMIVKPNDDELESKSSDKIVVNYGVDHIDYLYGIGRKVLISYNGTILETYPAQISSNDISTQGYLNFEILVEKSDTIKEKKILNNKEIYKDNSEYSLYYYGLKEVSVKINEEVISLKDALISGKITMDGIIAKANKEVQETEEQYSKFEDWQSVPQIFPYAETYKDGGSIKYTYEDYSIIKYHTLNGNRDIWIGIPEMKVSK